MILPGGTTAADDALAALSGGPEAALPPLMRDHLRETALTVNELLRHFWGSFPLTSAVRETRVLRIKAALASQFDHTTAMQV